MIKLLSYILCFVIYLLNSAGKGGGKVQKNPVDTFVVVANLVTVCADKGTFVVIGSNRDIFVVGGENIDVFIVGKDRDAFVVVDEDIDAFVVEYI